MPYYRASQKQIDICSNIRTAFLRIPDMLRGYLATGKTKQNAINQLLTQKMGQLTDQQVNALKIIIESM
ncbi:MAG: hypothetical protein ACI837_001008 [Crocinitomicaceae bacterium]|jgi:hypothetical protein